MRSYEVKFYACEKEKNLIKSEIDNFSNLMEELRDKNYLLNKKYVISIFKLVKTYMI